MGAEVKHFDWWVFSSFPETNINIPETNISLKIDAWKRRFRTWKPSFLVSGRVTGTEKHLKVDAWKTTVLRFLVGFDLEIQFQGGYFVMSKECWSHV